MPTMTPDILQEQLAYYRARAQEYDESLSQTGRFATSEPANEALQEEWDEAVQAVRNLGAFDRVLELACGTGLWTQELLHIGKSINALDGASEMIEVNRAKLADSGVTYQCVDLFTWEPDGEYDLVFFAFWLSHVPPDRLDAFLDKVRRAVRPGGKLFIVDEPAGGEHLSGPVENGMYQTRPLLDGRTFNIVKVYYHPDAIREKLIQLNFEHFEVVAGSYFFRLIATGSELR